MGNRGAAAVLGLPVKRIREWCKDEKGMREALSNGSVTHDAKSMGGGSRPSTASVEQELVEYVNELTNLGLEVGRDMILSKLLSLEPKALGGMPPASDLSGVEKFQAKFRQWLRRFKVRHKATLAKLSSADQ